jgi:NAD(P)-dependent dehydrogenase (short-subunit alcohol dehydrogenase family)
LSTEAFAIVTGASSGIGRAAVESLLERGFVVFGGSRSGTDIDDENFYDIDMDVTKEASVSSFFNEVRTQTDSIDLVVNAAGLGAISSLRDLPGEKLLSDLMVKPYGLFNLFKCLESFLIQDETHVINLLSLTALEGYENTLSLSASEHAAKGLLQAIEKEWDRYGTRFSNLFFGAVDTPFWNEAPLEVDRSSMMNLDEFMFMFESIVDAPATIQFPQVVFKHRDERTSS